MNSSLLKTQRVKVSKGVYIMAKQITVTLVFDTDGNVNVEASREAFEAEMDLYLSDENEIAEAVNAVFSQYKGATINMPALAGFAMQRLKMTPSNFATLEERIGDYVRENADRHEKKDKETGVITQVAEPQRTRLFSIAKGKGGGVKRWSDIPVKA